MIHFHVPKKEKRVGIGETCDKDVPLPSRNVFFTFKFIHQTWEKAMEWYQYHYHIRYVIYFFNHDIDNFFFPQKDGGKLAFAGVGTFPFELPYGGSSQGIGAAVAGFARGTLDAAKGWR